MIPTYEEIMLPLLKNIADGKEHSLSETVDALAKSFGLSDEELRELLPSGRQPVFRNRVGWARTYMKKAGLLTSTKRAHFKITDRGIKLLQENPTEITAKLLTRYDEFVEFKTISREKENEPISGVEHVIVDSDQTPEESLEYAYQKLRSELSKELLVITWEC